jgi:hypothetical protein
MTALKARNDIMKKVASFREVKKLIVNAPRDMAVHVTKQLKENELNFGGTEPNVVTKIGRISGRLAGSFNQVQIDPHTWGVEQTTAQAPYAGDVAVYSMRRWGMTYLDSVRRRTHDFLLKEAIEEFEYAWKLIAAGKSFTYHPLYGE